MYAALCKAKPVVLDLDAVRAAALMNLAYQLGVPGLLKFKMTWEAIEDKDYVRAATCAWDSKWAKQTPRRARRVCKALATGAWPKEVKDA